MTRSTPRDTRDKAYWKRYRRTDPRTSRKALEGLNLPRLHRITMDIFYSDIERSTTGKGWIAWDLDQIRNGLWRRSSELREKYKLIARRVDPETGEFHERMGGFGKMQQVYWLGSEEADEALTPETGGE